MNGYEKMREALTKLVAYLDKEVRRTAKCKRCKFNGKSFRGEPCYWHVDCGIDQHDNEASDNAMYLLNRFKLQEALDLPRRQCDVGTAEEQERRFRKYCETKECDRYRCGHGCKAVCIDRCAVAWSQMPYAKEGSVK